MKNPVNPIKPDLKAIGKRVKLLRVIELDLNQTEFGAKLGVSAPMISKIERGNSEPTLTFLFTLSGLTGKSLDWILRGE